jgi:hypothetical protein
MKESNRILLARPSSGFVDILNQIVTSYEWAQTLSRHLVVDTRWGNWRDALDYYFDVLPVHASHISLASDDDALSTMTVHPALLSDLRDRSYRRKLVRDDAGNLRVTDARSGLDISSYNVPDCSKDVIVHHPIGGGERAAEALGMLTLTPELRRLTSEAMRDVPRPYNAVHLRNTDLVASLDDAREQIAMLNPDVPILVASDNAMSLSAISEMCPRHVFLSVTENFSSSGTPLHFDTSLDARRRNVEALTDVLALASADALVVPNIVRGPKSSSGYSRLALELREDSALLSQLLTFDGAI